MSESPEEKPRLASGEQMTSLGLGMAAGMAVFTFIGYKIDQSRGGGRSFTLGGIFLGLLYCGYEVWKLVKRSNK